jgi:xylan 1,4-beta-xylosidase
MISLHIRHAVDPLSPNAGPIRTRALCLVCLMLVSVVPSGASDDRPARVRAERQPVADQGNGTYTNPILAGEYPDPSVVRVGSDYYLTHTPGQASPGLLVWHSRDLVNWEPLGPALTSYLGDVWAPDIAYLDGLFYIYFPARVRATDGTFRRTSFVITAKDPRGPWSAPVDLKVPGIDPGHIADRQGRRWLYLSDGVMVRLSADGLRAESAPAKVYDGWDIPKTWNIECQCLESPKLFERQGYVYLVSAQGGTAGPSTSHMIVVARAKSPEGPWENMPANPLLRTQRRGERWWSQGHGTMIEAADGSWWVMFHAFENGFRTLGRQTLLLPVEWTVDGWPRMAQGRSTQTHLVKPTGENVGHGMPLSDRFDSTRLGPQWKRWEPGNADGVYAVGQGALRMTARGTTPGEGAMVSLVPANHSYEAQVEVEVAAGVEAGLLLHFDAEHFGGVGVSDGQVQTYILNRSLQREDRAHAGKIVLKIRNTEHDVEFFTSPDGVAWTRLETGVEMSGYHHDVFRNWQTLKVALYATGSGTAVFRNFKYQGLPETRFPMF